MRPRTRQAIAAVVFSFAALWFSGCGSAPEPAPAEDKAAIESVRAQDEAHEIATAALGKGAEILASGDLALDGRQQLLVVNRVPAAAQSGMRDADRSTVFVTRAAVLEKNDGKWAQILGCDEHLKNTHGYLGGSFAGRITAWRLEFNSDPKNGLQMKFIAIKNPGEAGADPEQNSGKNAASFDVRWNKNTNRYQTFDKTQGRYLAEVPSLETPESTLK